MARVLVHYDIPEEDFRNKFRDSITGLYQPFIKITESVYFTQVNLTEKEINKLKNALRTIASDAPPDSKIYMEHPDMWGNHPEIIQTIIKNNQI